MSSQFPMPSIVARGPIFGAPLRGKSNASHPRVLDEQEARLEREEGAEGIIPKPLACEPLHVPPIVDLHKLDAELGRDRIHEFAVIVNALTFGEMMEMCGGVDADKADARALKLHKWASARISGP